MSRKKSDAAPNIDAAAKAAYVGFVRECGYEKDARIPDYEKLLPEQHERWKQVARDVIAAAK